MAIEHSHNPRLWPTAGGDNSRRGLFSGGVGPSRKPQRVLQAHGAVQASVVFDEQGRAFVADMAGWVQAFSAEGKRLWETPLRGGVSASPAVHEREPWVFVGTHRGELCALETTSGRVGWRRLVPTESDPRILSDLLYWPESNTVVLSSWGGRFVALDAATGDDRFGWAAGISPSSAAAADGAGNLYCLRAVANRGVEWVRVTPTGGESLLHVEPEDKRGARRALVSAAPVCDEEHGLMHAIVNQEGGAWLVSWSIKSGAVTRRVSVSSAVGATPAVLDDGTVVVADRAGVVQAIGVDGGVRYRYATGADYLLAGPVAEKNGWVFVGDPLGVLHCIGPAGTGERIFEAERAIQARPSFDTRGSLFVPCTDRAVYVFAARSA